MMHGSAKKIGYIVVMGLVFMLLFSACRKNSHLADLVQYIAQLKKRETVSNQPAEKIAVPAPVVYSAAPLRAPFGQTATGEKTTVMSKEAEANPLLAYSLSMLRFMGTLSHGRNMVAFILAPDNKVYEVKIGDEMGDTKGKVIHIESDRIDIKEPNGITTTLKLKDEH